MRIIIYLKLEFVASLKFKATVSNDHTFRSNQFLIGKLFLRLKGDRWSW